jgi:hypothetical protein
VPAKASLAEAAAVNESAAAAETPASCKDRLVTAVTGVTLFAGLINLAALSVLAYPRGSARCGRNWPKPLATGRPEDGIWSGHRHWPEPEVFSLDVDQQDTRPDQRH